jgi:hypothetical protein
MLSAAKDIFQGRYCATNNGSAAVADDAASNTATEAEAATIA